MSRKVSEDVGAMVRERKGEKERERERERESHFKVTSSIVARVCKLARLLASFSNYSANYRCLDGQITRSGGIPIPRGDR